MSVELSRPVPRPRAESMKDTVVVTAHRQLVRDAVSLSLSSYGFAAVSMPLPVTASQILDMRRGLAGSRPAIGLLIGEVADAPQLRELAAVISGIDIAWVVLTGTPAGPAWGALQELGAHEVVAETTTLAALGGLLLDVAARCMPATATERHRSWSSGSHRQRQLARCLQRLSAREMQILVSLADGSSVMRIAESAGVAEGTVRTQVKSILRKLAVNSQLQAVAALREANEWLTD